MVVGIRSVATIRSTHSVSVIVPARTNTLHLTSSSWIDILMRQYGPSRSSSGNANGLQMLVCRNRPPFKMITWEPRPDALGHDTKDTVSELLTPQQIQHNTTRGHTPGLIDPNLPDTPRNRIPIPTRLSNAGQHKGPRRPGGAKPRKRRERATVGTKIGTGNSPKQDNRAASEESGRSQSGVSL